MSLKEDLKKLKERLEGQNGGSNPTPAEVLPKVPHKPTKVPKAEVVYKCGHTISAGELKNHDCRQCQLEKRQQGNSNQRRGGKGKGRSIVARLPKGSTYRLDYREEGDKKWWSGWLMVPQPGQDALALTPVFEGEADSVHYLLDLLGKKWRGWEREEAAKRAESNTVIPPECSA